MDCLCWACEGKKTHYARLCDVNTRDALDPRGQNKCDKDAVALTRVTVHTAYRNGIAYASSVVRAVCEDHAMDAASEGNPLEPIEGQRNVFPDWAWNTNVAKERLRASHYLTS